MELKMERIAKKAESHSDEPFFTYVPQDQLRFDPSNPRLGGEAKKSTQQEIQKYLESVPHVALELVDSFVENGFMEYEPLVVRKDGEQYVVIEGNRRLAAVRHILANPSKFSQKVIEGLQKIPVLIFRQKGDAPNRELIGTYLGLRHLLGYREWPPESKAIFLDGHIKSASDLRRLTKELGVTKSVISRYLIPYRVQKAASNILEKFEETEDKKFWMLGEALRRSNISEYIKLKTDPDSLKVISFDKTKLRFLLEFLYGSSEEGRRGGYRAVTSARITETRQLSRLGRVLSSKKAAEKLESGSTIEDAELYVEAREETLEGLINDLQILLQRIISMQPNNEELAKIEKHFQAFQKAIQAFYKNAKV